MDKRSIALLVFLVGCSFDADHPRDAGAGFDASFDEGNSTDAREFAMDGALLPPRGLRLRTQADQQPEIACFACCVGSSESACCVEDSRWLLGASCLDAGCDGFRQVGVIAKGSTDELLLGENGVRAGYITNEPLPVNELKATLEVDFVYGDCEGCRQEVAVSLGTLDDLDDVAAIELAYSRSRNQVVLVALGEPIWGTVAPTESKWTLTVGTEGQVLLKNGDETVHETWIGKTGLWSGRVYGRSANPDTADTRVGVREVSFSTELCDAPRSWAQRELLELLDVEPFENPSALSVAKFGDRTVLAFEANPVGRDTRETFLGIADAGSLSSVPKTYPLVRSSITSTDVGFRLVGAEGDIWVAYEGSDLSNLERVEFPFPIAVDQSVGAIAQVRGVDGWGYIVQSSLGNPQTYLQLDDGTEIMGTLPLPTWIGASFDSPSVTAYRGAFHIAWSSHIGLRASVAMISSDDLVSFTIQDEPVLAPRQGLIDQIGSLDAAFIHQDGRLDGYYVADDGVRKSLAYASRRLNEL